MNNEIKEILESMKEISEYEYTTDWFELNYEDTKILLDYITNLQERIDKAIEYIEKYLYDYVIDEHPDEQSIFYDEEDRFIPNAKEILLNILQGEDNE